MLTRRLQELQQSTKWEKFVDGLTNTLMVLGLIYGIAFILYLLNGWFFA